MKPRNTASRRVFVEHNIRVSQSNQSLLVTPPAVLTNRTSTNRQSRELRLKEPPASPWLNPTQLERPAFLLNFPFSYATAAANNPWMQDLPPDRRQPDFKRAAVQFLELYRNLCAEALVYLLPTPRGKNLQDLVYTANLGIVLEHLPDKNTVVISNSWCSQSRGRIPWSAPSCWTRRKSRRWKKSPTSLPSPKTNVIRVSAIPFVCQTRFSTRRTFTI